jgi:hypothetical protein
MGDRAGKVSIVLIAGADRRATLEEFNVSRRGQSPGGMAALPLIWSSRAAV